MKKFPIEAIMVGLLVTAMMAVFFTFKGYRASENLNSTLQSIFQLDSDYLNN